MLGDLVFGAERFQAMKRVWDALVDEDGYPIDAPCSQDPDGWFPGVGGDNRWAKDVCKRVCPARAECEAYALIAGETVGIWGARSAQSIKRGTTRPWMEPKLGPVIATGRQVAHTIG